MDFAKGRLRLLCSYENNFRPNSIGWQDVQVIHSIWYRIACAVVLSKSDLDLSGGSSSGDMSWHSKQFSPKANQQMS